MDKHCQKLKLDSLISMVFSWDSKTKSFSIYVLGLVYGLVPSGVLSLCNALIEIVQFHIPQTL